MVTFGKKIVLLRKEKNLSQTEPVTILINSVSFISRYERDDMKPSIDAAKKLADLLNTTVVYLLGENEDVDILKEPKMLLQLKTINAFPYRKNNRYILPWMPLFMNLKQKSLR